MPPVVSRASCANTTSASLMTTDVKDKKYLVGRVSQVIALVYMQINSEETTCAQWGARIGRRIRSCISLFEESHTSRANWEA